MLWCMTPRRSLLTADEVGEEFQILAETVRRWAREGRLQAVPLPGGRLIRFRRTDIEAIIAGTPNPPAVAADTAADNGAAA